MADAMAEQIALREDELDPEMLQEWREYMPSLFEAMRDGYLDRFLRPMARGALVRYSALMQIAEPSLVRNVQRPDTTIFEADAPSPTKMVEYPVAPADGPVPNQTWEYKGKSYWRRDLIGRQLTLPSDAPSKLGGCKALIIGLGNVKVKIVIVEVPMFNSIHAIKLQKIAAYEADFLPNSVLDTFLGD